MRRRMLIVPWGEIEKMWQDRLMPILPKEYQTAKLCNVVNLEDCAAFGFIYESDTFEIVPQGTQYPREVVQSYSVGERIGGEKQPCNHSSIRTWGNICSGCGEVVESPEQRHTKQCDNCGVKEGEMCKKCGWIKGMAY